jgi:urease accessory protein UreF
MNSEKSILYRGHYAPLFGVICGLHNFSIEVTEIMYLRCVLRDCISAACRLNIIGPIEGTKLQIIMSQKLEKKLQQSKLKLKNESTTVPVYLISNEFLQYLKPTTIAYLNQKQKYKENKLEKTSTSPVLELIQSQHEQLYSRLFVS